MTRFIKALCLTAVLSTQGFAGYKANSIDIKEYPKGDILITAEDAIKLIGKKGVVFVSGDSPDSYNNQHIDGSVVMGAHHLHHSNIMGQMHCAPLYQCVDHVEHLLGENGIDNNTLVIAYDDYRGPNSTGVYSFFTSYGHDNIKVMMGGFKAIQALDPAQQEFNALKKEVKPFTRAHKKASKKLKAFAKAQKKLKKAQKANETKKIAKYQKIVDKGDLTAEQKTKLTKVVADNKAKEKVLKTKMKEVKKRLLVNKKPVHPEHKHYHIDPKKLDYSRIAGKDEVLHAVQDIEKNGKNSKYIIIDARGMIEIIGQRKMDNVARGGHIPGSTFLEWKKVSDDKRGVSMRPAKELIKMFKANGVTKDKTIYAYCHVGAGRGSEVITALQVLGYKNAKVYTGSWDEWGNDMALPIKR